MNPNAPRPEPTQSINGTPMAPPPAVQDPGKGWAIASLVLWFCGLSLIGIICAVVSRKKTRGAGLPASTLATVSLVINILQFILAMVVVLGLVLTTYGGIQQKARNSKRQIDVQSIQSQIDTYYGSKGYYPSLGDLNSASWRSQHLSNFDDNSLADPSNTKVMPVSSSPAAHQYSYQVTDKNGSSCEETDTKCAKYTLTATYEGSVNGQTTFAVQNVN